jgi:phage tail-like protein
VKYGNLILKRGIPLAENDNKLASPMKVRDSKIVEWATKAIERYKFEPLDINVYLLNDKSEPMITWHFYKAWPVKLVTTDLKAQDNSILIESFELAYERFTRRKA